jgi:hypothetical protein
MSSPDDSRGNRCSSVSKTRFGYSVRTVASDTKVRDTIFGRTGFTLSLDECHVGKHDVSHVPFDVVAVERDTLRVLRQCQAHGAAAVDPEDQGGFEGLVARQPTT